VAADQPGFDLLAALSIVRAGPVRQVWQISTAVARFPALRPSADNAASGLPAVWRASLAGASACGCPWAGGRLAPDRRLSSGNPDQLPGRWAPRTG